ncbi:MAG: glucosaminidase domain-containing protein [Flavobacteriales bacterium]|nr:glucosaminidase domain-containing protein [Flavobacteriales bacterium]
MPVDGSLIRVEYPGRFAGYVIMGFQQCGLVDSRKRFVLLLSLMPCASAFAQPSGQRLSAEEYIAMWQEVAVREMERHRIPASITLAQGLLESGNGNSELARKANNHFGIKCTSSWTGGKVYHDDDRRNECFRKYKNAEASYTDHSEFLLKQRYASLFQLDIRDYKGWAKGLKAAGYATDPRYPQKLIDLIERYQLHELDKGGRAAAKRSKPQAGSERTERQEEVTVTVGGSRAIQVFDGRIKYVLAKEGDTFDGLAAELGHIGGQLARYNDLDKNTRLKAGQVVFIQPKRNSSKRQATHTVRDGEDLWSISQQEGIKLAKLAEWNGLSTSAKVSPGTKLLLKKPRKRR